MPTDSQGPEDKKNFCLHSSLVFDKLNQKTSFLNWLIQTDTNLNKKNTTLLKLEIPTKIEIIQKTCTSYIIFIHRVKVKFFYGLESRRSTKCNWQCSQSVVNSK